MFCTWTGLRYRCRPRSTSKLNLAGARFRGNTVVGDATHLALLFKSWSVMILSLWSLKVMSGREYTSMDDLLVFILVIVSYCCIIILHCDYSTGIGTQVGVPVPYICMGSSHMCSSTLQCISRIVRNISSVYPSTTILTSNLNIPPFHDSPLPVI